MADLQFINTTIGRTAGSRKPGYSFPLVFASRFCCFILIFIILTSASMTTAIAQNQISPTISPRNTTNSIPLFEKKRELHYRFGREPAAILKPSIDLNKPESLYHFDVHTTENIQHAGRDTLIANDLQSQFFLAQRTRRASSSSSSASSVSYDLLVYPYQLTSTDSKMGESARIITLDPELGLIQSYRDGRTTRTSLDESFGRSGSLLASIARPLRMHLKDGILQENPAESPFLETLRLTWIDSGFLTMLPPLPQKKIRTGQTWQGFITLQASQFAQPASVPCSFRFRSYDEETKLAEVTWSINSMRLPLTPVNGIHHISTDSVAVINAAGITTINLDTSRVKSAEAMIKAEITNTAKKDFTVQTVRTIHLRSVK